MIPEEPVIPYQFLFGKAVPGSGPPHSERCARWTRRTVEIWIRQKRATDLWPFKVHTWVSGKVKLFILILFNSFNVSKPNNDLRWKASHQSVTNRTWLRRRLTFRQLCCIIQKLWRSSGLKPIALQNTTLVPKKSACFLQHIGRDIDTHRLPPSAYTSISLCIPRELSRGGQSCFCLANNSVLYFHTGLFAHARLHS